MKSTTTTKNSPTTAAAAVASDHGTTTTTTTSSLDDLKHHLPSEQDRKATLGCLAAVLNRMFQHQFYGSQHSAALPTRSKKGVPLKTASLVSSKRNSDSNINTSVTNRNTQRTREFQNELLVTACELLYLDPNIYAVEFFPILDNHNDSSSNNSESTLSQNKKNDEKSNEDKDEDDTGDDDQDVSSSSSTNEDFLLDPFLSSFSNAKAGFDCISLLLFRYLLLSSNSNNDEEKDDQETSQKNQSNTNNSKTILGYDARVRYALKYTSVSILKYWDPVYGRSTSGLYTSKVAGRKYATQKYEALEDAIAQRISTVSKQIIIEGHKISNSNKNQLEKDQTNNNSDDAVKTKAIKKKNKIIRGLKIGSAAIGAGALMALSGGIAVPAIIGGIAAAAGITAVGFGTLTVISLLVLPAAVTIFGVGSGVLVAGKMTNRTRGLTDFEIKLAVNDHNKNDGNDDNDDTSDDNPPQKSDQGEQPNEPKQQAQQQQRLKLARTICINGWIADKHDFERPFGTHPQSLEDKSELLKRYCSVYAPQVLPHCDELLEEWKTKEDELWNILRDAYGKDPNHLYPLDNNQDDNLLTTEEQKSIDSVMRSVMGIQPDMLQKMLEKEMPSNTNKKSPKNSSPPPILLEEVWNTTTKKKKLGSDISDNDILNDKRYRPYVAWDFRSTYRGMELYTVSWEQDLLLQLRGSAKDLQKDLAMKGAEQVMKKTVLATLMSAVAIPATLLGLTSLIDEKWTMANERADEAGILLAESLLVSTAGHRPINLIGISFGARMILSCLQELARHQKKWEKEQQRVARGNNQKGGGKLGLWKAGDAIRKSITDSVTSKLGSNSKGSDSNPNNESSATSYLREPASIIENVVLMGCPASVKPSTWKSIRGVVAGPLINCYAPNDLMLSLMYRIKNPTTALLNPPVGITQVKASGVTNCDVSSLIGSTNHGDYSLVVKDILDLVGFDQPQKG